MDDAELGWDARQTQSAGDADPVVAYGTEDWCAVSVQMHIDTFRQPQGAEFPNSLIAEASLPNIRIKRVDLPVSLDNVVACAAAVKYAAFGDHFLHPIVDAGLFPRHTVPEMREAGRDFP